MIANQGNPRGIEVETCGIFQSHLQVMLVNRQEQTTHYSSKTKKDFIKTSLTQVGETKVNLTDSRFLEKCLEPTDLQAA